jgi:hypothetical protein
MNERIDRQELEALEGLVDVVFDAAEWVKAMEGPSRWLVISGSLPGRRPADSPRDIETRAALLVAPGVAAS